MPARKKTPGTQQDRRPQRSRVTTLAVVRDSDKSDKPEIPPLPKAEGGLLVTTKEAWLAFWTGPTAPVAEQVDRVITERWILAYDEWRRALNAVRKARLVKGSKGQPVMNPLADWAASREAAMRLAEKEMGVGLKSRADLGVSIGQAQLTAEELNRMTEESDGDQEDVIDADEAELLEGFEEAR